MLHILYLIHLGNNSGLRGRTYKLCLHLTALEEKQGKAGSGCCGYRTSWEHR